MTQALPVLGTNFVLDIDGVGKFPIISLTVAGLSAPAVREETVDASGMSMSKVFVDRTDVAEFTVVRPLTGGETDSLALYNWHVESADGHYVDAARNGTLTGYDTRKEPVTAYEFTAGWPKLYKFPALDANGGAILTEEITIVCNEWRRVQ